MSDVKSFQRQLVVQAFYEVSINTYRKDTPIDEIFLNIINQSNFKKKLINSNLKLAKEIYSGVFFNIKKIDELLKRSLFIKNKLDSMDILLKCIFRSAIFELRIDKKISKKIIISEYLLITKRFFGEKECALINGVLDNLQDS